MLKIYLKLNEKVRKKKNDFVKKKNVYSIENVKNYRKKSREIITVYKAMVKFKFHSIKNLSGNSEDNICKRHLGRDRILF